MEFEVTMADIAKKPKPTAPSLCKRCNQNPPAITMRHEALCQDCFTTYIRTKFTRYMEPFRVKRGTELVRRKLMFATSFGVASTALLDLLHWHRSLQLERARRVEYDIQVVHIDESVVLGEQEGVEERLEKLREQYPQFEFSSSPLDRIYDLGNAAVEQLISDTEALNLDAPPMASMTPDINAPTGIEKLRSLLAHLNSRASQMDIVAILRSRLLIELAKKNACEAIFFADSMTRMAAMVLAEVTKGRGHALPWLISDGPTPYGPVKIVRPLRELTKIEISEYTTFCSLWPFCSISQEKATVQKPPVNMKNQTIDEVMGRFFEDVSNAHLVANVVKTAAKLEFPDDNNRVERLGLCEICGLPMDEEPKYRRINAQKLAGVEVREVQQPQVGSKDALDTDARIYCLEPPEGEEDLKERRCYGCRRSTLGAGKVDWPINNR
ncbi:cytoplasmic tRNA 2-thiolation protein 2 [Orbilia ellipsospora]|uniref:Cytoplasmic tRNA 2-thiolation protein 2 n=1 Tax=Orbilia ellipsospora TaxID=2528407 RepID=A0AAV9X219_9PEZI